VSLFFASNIPFCIHLTEIRPKLPVWGGGVFVGPASVSARAPRWAGGG